MKPTPNDNSTTRSPSYCEHVDKLYPESPTPKSQKSVIKGARISKLPLTLIPQKIPFIEEIPVFMHKYIDRVFNVERDGNCGYRAVSVLLGKGEDSHALIRHQLIQELKAHKDSYTRLYGKKEKFDAVYESLIPCLSGPEPMSKWMTFPDMGHPIACAYDRVCIEFTRYGFSETFFPLRTAPPQNPNDRIMCIGWLEKSRHFVQVYLNPGCPIPPTSPEWVTRSTVNAERWPNHFVERMHKFERLNNIEKESNAEKSKGVPPIDLASDTCFDSL